MPKSLLEAAACGLPIITTDTPGCRDICRDGVNGLLVPVRDASAIAQAIQLLAADLPCRLKMGRESRRLVETQFSDTVVYHQMLELFNQFSDVEIGISDF